MHFSPASATKCKRTKNSAKFGAVWKRFAPSQTPKTPPQPTQKPPNTQKTQYPHRPSQKNSKITPPPNCAARQNANQGQSSILTACFISRAGLEYIKPSAGQHVRISYLVKRKAYLASTCDGLYPRRNEIRYAIYEITNDHGARNASVSQEGTSWP